MKIYLIYFQRTIKYALFDKIEAEELLKTHRHTCKSAPFIYRMIELEVKNLEQIFKENPELEKKQRKMILDMLKGD